MAIPKRTELWSPILEMLSDGNSYSTSEIADTVASRVGVTAEDKKIVTSSRRPLYYNRVAWACFDLKQKGLITHPSRGCYRLAQQSSLQPKSPILAILSVPPICQR